jgi:NADH-quinone oxidoreductase subunit G
MNAAIAVSEPKPPEDADSSLSYTMEGYRGLAPSTMIPFFWSPGWNSVQSINKYQEEVGHSLRGGDPGLRLLEPVQGAKANYFKSVPEAFRTMKEHLLIIPLHHIFGSDEASAFSPPVIERIPKPYVLVNDKDAAALSVIEGHLFAFEIEEQYYELPVKISARMPEGVAGLPYGLPGLPFVDLPAWAIIK